MTKLGPILKLLAAGAIGLAACGLPGGANDPGSARLTARPNPPTASITPGLWPLDLEGNGRDGYLLVPSSYDPARPMPLVLALHGAGIGAQGPINFLSPYAEAHGFLLLAVESRGNTWDAIYGPYGPDVAVIDGLLRYAFDHCRVDFERLVVEGFSDGASYALGLGRANGDLFDRVVAFSPGFVPATSRPDTGKPAFFISHGRQDPVLPIDQTSRLIAPSLQRAGYDVTYVEFDGVHTVPSEIAQQAVLWLVR